jgi:hypothetical protein
MCPTSSAARPGEAASPGGRRRRALAAWLAGTVVAAGLGWVVGRTTATPSVVAGGPAGPQAAAPESPAAKGDSRTSVRARPPGRAEQRAALAALPYVEGAADSDPRRGVVLHHRDRATPGVNLYCSRDRRAAVLLAADGAEITHWRFPLRGVEHCELLPDGGVLGLVSDRAVVRLDAGGRELWRYEAEVHHAFWRDEAERIYLLERRVTVRPELHPTLRVYEDFVVVLGADGARQSELSLLDLLLASPYRFLLPATDGLDTPGEEDGAPEASILDLLHPNQIEVLGADTAPRVPAWDAGDWLLCLRNLNALLVVDPRTRRVRWIWGPGNLTYPHHPSVMASGRLLVFDNGTTASALVELDPLAQAVTWRYAPAEGFFTATRGSVQELAGGNLLVTESNRGRVFELTRSREVVWEWWNPHRLADGKREAVWRMIRYPESAPGVAIARASSRRRASV